MFCFYCENKKEYNSRYVDLSTVKVLDPLIIWWFWVKRLSALFVFCLIVTFHDLGIALITCTDWLKRTFLLEFITSFDKECKMIPLVFAKNIFPSLAKYLCSNVFLGNILKYFWVKLHQKCPFVKILDATLKSKIAFWSSYPWALETFNFLWNIDIFKTTIFVFSA